MLMKSPGYRRGLQPRFPTWLLLLYAGVFVFLLGFACGVFTLVVTINAR